MILTCPSCSVRYLVDARALGLKGRTVRCARCSHTWLQAPPDEPSPETMEAMAAAAAVIAKATPAEPPAAPKPAPPPVLSPPLGPVPELTAEQRIQLPALPRRKRRWGPALALAVALLAILAGIGYAAVVERDRVVGKFPATARYFALAGFPASDTGIGLEFRNVTTSRDMENGLPSLVIEGEVKNVSSGARTVPKLVVTLRDRTEHELQNAVVEPPTERLQPGESANFHTTITQPAEAATGVVVTFATSSGN